MRILKRHPRAESIMDDVVSLALAGTMLAAFVAAVIALV
ncbi:hypothetical protein AEYBE204_04405 [Asticcacaulis sp. YBE204]|nr:hypothetical protein AEYBE204_04405 [Asticcacaulis sp. YBE204]